MFVRMHVNVQKVQCSSFRFLNHKTSRRYHFGRGFDTRLAPFKVLRTTTTGIYPGGLPYVAYSGMCRWTGYSFHGLQCWQDIIYHNLASWVACLLDRKPWREFSGLHVWYQPLFFFFKNLIPYYLILCAKRYNKGGEIRFLFFIRVANERFCLKRGQGWKVYTQTSLECPLHGVNT